MPAVVAPLALAFPSLRAALRGRSFPFLPTRSPTVDALPRGIDVALPDPRRLPPLPDMMPGPSRCGSSPLGMRRT
eukprot:13508667-Heterocapsa_arctica.AAC.1